MPLYEYACDKCHYEFEEIHSPDDPEPQCPKCGSGKVSKLVSAFSVRPHGIPRGKGGFKGPACKSALINAARNIPKDKKPVS